MIHRIPIIALTLLMASCLTAETTTKPAAQATTERWEKITLSFNGRTADVEVQRFDPPLRIKPIELSKTSRGTPLDTVVSMQSLVMLGKGKEGFRRYAGHFTNPEGFIRLVLAQLPVEKWFERVRKQQADMSALGLIRCKDRVLVVVWIPGIPPLRGKRYINALNMIRRDGIWYADEDNKLRDPIGRHLHETGYTIVCQAAPATKPATQPTSGPTTTTTTTSAPVVDPAVMAILRRLEAAGKKYPNITAEIDYKVDMLQVGDTERRTGKVFYQGQTKKTPPKFRIRFETLRQGKGPKIKDVVDYAFDGEWLTIRKERIKQMTKIQVAPPGKKVNPIQLGKGPFPVPFGQKAEDVIKHFRPSTRPAKKSDPKNTDYLKLVTRRRYRRDFSVVWLEMWVDRKSGLPMKIAAEDRSENLTTVVFRKIATPKRFPKKTFALPRPPGGWEYNIEPYRGTLKP